MGRTDREIKRKIERGKEKDKEIEKVIEKGRGGEQPELL